MTSGAGASARIARPLGLLGDDDLPWIGALTDTVVRFAGPAVAARARRDRGRRMDIGHSPRSSTRRRGERARRADAAAERGGRCAPPPVAGRAYNIALARKARSLVLGRPP